MTPHIVDLAFLFVMVLLLSTGLLLWLKSLKKRPHFLTQLALVVGLVALILGGLKLSGTSLGFLTPALAASSQSNAFREALELLDQPYPSYTTANNIAGASREDLVQRFQKMEKLDLGEVKQQVNALRTMIENAPSSGQSGIYNMRITSDIQARWDELRRELKKRAE
jgi:hypothetical protein